MQPRACLWIDNQCDELLTQLTKNQRQRSKINKLRNKRSEVTTDTTEIQRVVSKYPEQLYANNLDEIDQFLEIHNLPILSEEESGMLNTLIRSWWNWNSDFKKMPKEKRARPRQLQRGVLSNIQKIIQIVPKSPRGTNTPKLFLGSLNNPNYETR